VSDPAVVKEVAEACGLDGAAIVAAGDQQEIKDALRRSTGEAVERGAFGAPAMFVGDEQFWGNDRLEQLERHLTKA
jgi:2-hydroxychromene-2-carboxylate isomerase